MRCFEKGFSTKAYMRISVLAHATILNGIMGIGGSRLLKVFSAC